MSRSIKIKCPKLCLLYFFFFFFYSSNFISGKNVAVVQIQTDVHCLDVCIVDLSAVQMRESVFFIFYFFYQRNNKLSCIYTCTITWLRPKPLMDNHHGPPMSAPPPYKKAHEWAFCIFHHIFFMSFLLCSGSFMSYSHCASCCTLCCFLVAKQ